MKAAANRMLAKLQTLTITVLSVVLPVVSYYSLFRSSQTSRCWSSTEERVAPLEFDAKIKMLSSALNLACVDVLAAPSSDWRSMWSSITSRTKTMITYSNLNNACYTVLTPV